MLQYFLFLEMIAELILDEELANNLKILFAKKFAEYGDSNTIDAQYYAQKSTLFKDVAYPYSVLYGSSHYNSHNYLFSHGFAKVGWVNLFGFPGHEDKVKRLLYLRHVDGGGSELKELQLASEKEKLRRKKIDVDKIFSTHKIGLLPPDYSWTFSSFFHANTTTPIVHLTEGISANFKMPIKDVSKPTSSFYGINRPNLGEDDC